MCWNNSFNVICNKVVYFHPLIHSILFYSFPSNFQLSSYSFHADLCSNSWKIIYLFLFMSNIQILNSFVISSIFKKVIYMNIFWNGMHVWTPPGCLVHVEIKKGNWFSGTEITDTYKPPCPCGGWELKLGLLEEQPVLLTTESSS